MSEAAGPEPAAVRWAEQLAGWGIPQHIVEQAPESPWGHDSFLMTVPGYQELVAEFLA